MRSARIRQGSSGAGSSARVTISLPPGPAMPISVMRPPGGRGPSPTARARASTSFICRCCRGVWGFVVWAGGAGRGTGSGGLGGFGGRGLSNRPRTEFRGFLVVEAHQLSHSSQASASRVNSVSSAGSSVGAANEGACAAPTGPAAARRPCTSSGGRVGSSRPSHVMHPPLVLDSSQAARPAKTEANNRDITYLTCSPRVRFGIAARHRDARRISTI